MKGIEQMQSSTVKKITFPMLRRMMSASEKLSLYRIQLLTIRFAVYFFALAGFVASASTVDGQGIDREYKLKAAFLYKFATYFKWPDDCFEHDKSPFVIGILGPNPVGRDLRRIAEVKRIDGRPIVIREFDDPEDIDKCHILFMSRALQSDKQKKALKHLAERNILFVGETPDFLKFGGVIDLLVHENYIRIYLSKSAYEREQLKTNAQFLRVATIMK